MLQKKKSGYYHNELYRIGSRTYPMERCTNYTEGTATDLPELDALNLELHKFLEHHAPEASLNSLTIRRWKNLVLPDKG